jgi:hypothetical protein
MREMSYELLDPQGSRNEVVMWDYDPAVHGTTEWERLRNFLRGDSNGDGATNITDAIHTLGYLFLGSSDVQCLAAADTDGSGALDITDAVATLGYLFLGTESAVAPPGPRTCSPDSQSTLGCVRYDATACPQPEGGDGVLLEM